MARVNIGVFQGQTVYRMVQITGLHDSRRVGRHRYLGRASTGRVLSPSTSL